MTARNRDHSDLSDPSDKSDGGRAWRFWWGLALLPAGIAVAAGIAMVVAGK